MPATLYLQVTPAPALNPFNVVLIPCVQALSTEALHRVLSLDLVTVMHCAVLALVWQAWAS